MNQFSVDVQPSDTLWYTPMDHHSSSSSSYPFFYHPSHLSSSIKYDDLDSDYTTSNAIAPDPSDTTASSTTSLDKQHMFEKPLTPSDVGKLNRLVIPKQHAEKYFPLAGVSATAPADSSAAGGLLLGFEDEGGKCWRFRYSYWNSSQSYVLTKGWSRYVKEKKLDAGDVVLFERHRFDSDRFFIGWRRRGSNPVHHVSPAQAAAAAWTAAAAHHQRSPSSYNNNHGYSNYHHHHQNVVQAHPYAASHQITPSFPCPPETGAEVRQRSKKSGSGNSKRVRLFGVNLECQLEDADDDHHQRNDDEPQTSDGSSLSTQGPGQGFGPSLGSGLSIGPTSYNYFDYVDYPPNHHNHMDMNYPHDVNQMRNRLG